MANEAGNIRPYSQEHIQNQSFDRDFQQSMVENLGFDGVNLQKLDADNLAIKITTSGSDTYVGEAAPGTAESTAKWKAYKVTSAGVVTFADGDSNFDNVATDLTSLSYS